MRLDFSSNSCWRTAREISHTFNISFFVVVRVIFTDSAVQLQLDYWFTPPILLSVRAFLMKLIEAFRASTPSDGNRLSKR